MNIVDKLEEIKNIIEEVKTEEPAIAQILTEGFGLSINIIRAVVENNGSRKIDVSEHLDIIAKIMGFRLEDLVESILEKKSAEGVNLNKQADKETLDFIVSTSSGDLDDYERFIEENKVKENLEFLNKEI